MKKFLCLLLAGLMLSGAVACGTPSDDTKDTNDGSKTPGDTTVESEKETVNSNYVCDLPTDLNYGGDEVTFLYADVNGRKDELVPDEAGGLVSDAVYERNVKVEEQLKIVMNMVTSDNLVLDMKKDYQGGTGAYDIVTCGTSTAITPALEGFFVNLTALEHIDTSKHYWTQGYNDMVTFTDADMQFLASGPVAISMFRYMFLTIYNKKLFNDYKLTDLYEVVKQGKWTLDYQYSILNGKYVEKDADGKPTAEDFYGFVTGDTVSVDPYLVAADVHMVIKDADTGMLQYNTEATNDLVALCDKVQKIYNDPSTYVYKTATNDDVPKTNIIDHFNAERALMATTVFYQMERNFSALSQLTYGIAPLPKFDEAQEEYNSYVQDQVSAFGITAAVSNTARLSQLSAVMEALAYHSYLIVRPAYYETALSERYMQDPQSSEVLDMIFETLRFDFSSSCCNIFSDCVIRDNLRPLLSGKSNTIVSSTKNWARLVDRTLSNKYNPKLEELKPTA